MESVAPVFNARRVVENVKRVKKCGRLLDAMCQVTSGIYFKERWRKDKIINVTTEKAQWIKR